MMSTEEKQEAVRGDDPASGMTIREHFAAMAMQGLLTDSGLKKSVYDLAKAEGQSPEQYISDMAVEHADALIAALEASK